MQIDWDELFRDSTPNQSPRLSRRWLLVLGLAVLFFLLLTVVGLITDWWWFASLAQAAVFQTRLLAPALLFLGAWSVGFLWLAANWLWASRRAVALAEADMPNQVPAGLVRTATRSAVLVTAAVVASFLASGLAAAWPEVLLYLNRQPFGVADPVFGLDVGFYVFQLPVWQLVRGLLMALVVAALLGAALLYTASEGLDLRRNRLSVGRALHGHVLALGALAVLLWAAGMWLARYELLFTAHTSSFFGPGYADLTARAPAYALLAAVGVVAAGLLLLSARVGGLRLAVWALAITGGLWLLAGELYPGLLQSWRVEPNELALERPYIGHNISATRAAFGLGDVKVSEYTPKTTLTPDLLDDYAATLTNIRLWDWRVFRETVGQMQEIRSYYEFLDVDIDRYQTADGLRQVNLSMRELLPSTVQNPSWVNLALEYTHGFGAVVSPIDEVEDRGLPTLWVKDIPPRTEAPFPIDLQEPRLYFGEAPDLGYVIVAAETDEFDYPSGDVNVRTRYDGADGVPFGSYFRRLLYAIRFGDVELLLSGGVTPESRLLLRRNIVERAKALAPFLQYDADPYPVITDDGRIVWILDAYTASKRYPYSTPLIPMAGANGSLAALAGNSYLRNSVKVAVDAYQGTAVFYVVDQGDPLVQAWAGVFPSLFRPASEMPADLVAHWRYPEALFRAQSSIYADYHVQDPATFYNAEDRWAVPNETGLEGRSGPMSPYYVLVRLRDEAQPEFVLILPFSPVGKDNMIAWLAARSDPPHYGEMVLYQFPKGSLVPGPQQVESLIQQDPLISAQVTLWGQSGSRVIYGNLLVIPVGDSILYVEPLYLRAEQGNAVPELKRVILAAGETVVMESTLDGAVAALFAEPAISGQQAGAPAGDPGPGSAGSGSQTGGAAGGGSGAAAGDGPGGAVDAVPVPGDLASIVLAAERHELAARVALQAGDWVAFGREMAALQRVIQQLGALTGTRPPLLEESAQPPDGAPSAGATPGEAAPTASPTAGAP